MGEVFMFYPPFDLRSLPPQRGADTTALIGRDMNRVTTRVPSKIEELNAIIATIVEHQRASPRPFGESGFADGRHERKRVSPDSERIEPTGALLRWRNSVSVEQIQDGVRARGCNI